MKFYKQTKLIFYFSLGLLIILGYWQISFFTAAFKWDMLDVVFPFRYYFSENIHSGFFPFWNPYQLTGTPYFADLQAPVYYPELLYTSLLGGYSVYTMHILFIGYLLISAWGMYRLSFYFYNSTRASFLAALAYVFSGYTIAHGQHFFLLVGMAWIPFVILSYIKLNQNLNLIDTIKAAIFVFLMVTGAYQALSIVLMYLLLLLFGYFMVKAMMEKNRRKIFQTLFYNLILTFLVVLLTLPLIVSTGEVLHSVSRLATGVQLQQGLRLTTLFSFLIPFSTITNTGFYGHADISLINHYFGIILLLFFILALFRKHSALEYVILFFGILIFSMSFEILPVRNWICHHLPLMNSFKYAAYLSIYGTLAFILMAAGYFAVFEKNVASERKKIMVTGSVFLALLAVLIVFSVQQGYHGQSFGKLLQPVSFFQTVFVQSAFDFIFVSGLMVTLIFYKKIKRPVMFIMVFTIGDLLLAAQLNMNTTVADTKYTPKQIQTNIDLCPKGFPIPVNDKIIFNDQQHAFFDPLWRNTYIFTKQISFTGFSSFKLNGYNKIDRFQNLKNATLNNHLFYFSDTIIPLSKFSDKVVQMQNSRYLFVPDKDFKILSHRNVKTNASDKVQILKFNPNKIVAKTTTHNDQFLTLLQANYKGWRAYIDNKPTHIYTSNFIYRTLFLPKGKHTVVLQYKNTTILVLYIVSNLVFLLLVLFLLRRRLSKKNDKSGKHIWIPLVILAVILLLVIGNFTHKNRDITTFQYYTAYFGKKNNYLGIKKYFEKESVGHGTTNPDTCRACATVEAETEYLPLVEIVQKNNKIKEGTLFVRARIYSRNYPDALLVSEIKNRWYAHVMNRQIEQLNHWNNLFYVRHIPKMKNGDVLKVYIWNPHKSRFTINNVSVNFYN